MLPFDDLSAGSAPALDVDLGSAIAEAVVERLSTVAAVAVVTPGDEAAWAVAGGIQRIGSMVRVTARLTDVRSGAVVKAVKVDGTIEALADLQTPRGGGDDRGRARSARRRVGREGRPRSGSRNAPARRETVMNNGGIAWFARNPVAANLMMVFIMVSGLIATGTVKEEVFPEVELDRISIQVPYLGAAPEEVEEGVVIRIEEAIQGVDGIKEIQSTASEGNASVMIELELGADARRVVDESRTRSTR